MDTMNKVIWALMVVGLIQVSVIFLLDHRIDSTNADNARLEKSVESLTAEVYYLRHNWGR